MPLTIDDILLARKSRPSLARQLSAAIQRQILDGRIIRGESLPASRELSATLNVARGTVVEAYAMLGDDGLVQSAGRAGTRVIYRLGQSCAKPTPASPPASARAIRMHKARSYAQSLPDVLTPGTPDPNTFPTSAWLRAARSAALIAPRGYDRSGGHPRLRTLLLRWLGGWRGIHVDQPSQLIMTTGSQGSLSLLARLLADRDERAAHESPGWAGAQAALYQAGLTPQALSVDQHGALPANGQWPRVTVITPNLQFPIGVVMPTERRQQFIESAIAADGWLIEDDYATEYIDTRLPPPSLFSLNQSHVVHIGTFSKLLMPAIRVGWMVVPQALAETMRQVVISQGLQPSVVIQEQLANFIEDGHLARHLAYTRHHYNQRRQAIRQHIISRLATLAAPPFQLGDSLSGMNQYLPTNAVTTRYLLDQPTALQGAEFHPSGPGLLIGHCAHPIEQTKAAFDRLLSALTNPAGK
ncbi:PLP-dependent aminotransferase family protein [Gammaproteobacteria bacterium]|nr:PLP-dependent aminotransferase family protein [Gammaproteobacteria bacterium]